ncbi:c-type cytochrome [Pseudodonghicola flavimaris]|uniref:C-type cytochrome n=1 Tax=Pseudodonghicola flavimaris TaxID=3050036 RepID=A0ABT7EYX5_9RHOB|nr:c-type cytochrome [Pseudodonghicola flavimaris]MDK3017551.1 c-type cytochrome [Pseudodonghicola flavimaris]
MSKFPKLIAPAAVAATLIAGPALAEKYGLGRPALPEEVAAWNLDVSPDGTGLPEGSGSVEDGEALFADYCAVCHGDFAEGVDNWPKLAGGMDTLDHEDPLKTVGSYWPYLSTTWDYVHRSMPFGNAQTLAPDEVYAIVAYILYSNDLVEDDFVLSKENFLDVEMPNRDGFIIDDRQTSEAAFWKDAPCMTDCKESVEITMRAAVLDVTPEETKARKVQEMMDATNPRSTEAAATTEAAAPVTEEVAAAAPAEEAPAVEAVPAAEALDPALVAKGEKVFKKCAACHQVGDGAKHRTGPILTGIVGHPAGASDGFGYSKAMKEAGSDGLVWSEEELHAFLSKPKQYMKKTKMSFAGLKKDSDIEAVIAYLKSTAQ